ncbi:protein LiaG [Spirochaetia bacterium]|nr:protein LiaG [Spirochaetia bacterium]
MKINFLVIAFLVLNTVLAYSGGLSEKNLVNTQEIELGNINDLNIVYTWENVDLFENDTDKLIIKEYMTINKSNYYARITSAGDKIRIEKGKRPFGLGTGILFNSFSARVEVYLPASYTKNISVKTASGNIKADGEFSCSEISIESSSGNMSIKTLAADTLKLKASSGNIGGETLRGNSNIHTSSGSIIFDNINSNVSAKSSSGRIELKRVTGSVTAEASSGSIRCTVTESAGNISLTAKSGGVTLNLPRNLVFNFSSKTSSGSLSTPFPERLFSPVSDRHTAQGIIGNENISGNNLDINIRTSSGSIKVNWVE